jgi:uncharacterized spore protein YtfJ
MEAIQALIERLDKVSEEANVDAVFGKPQTIEGRVLIPVAEVSYGFGMGAGSGPASCDCICHDQEEGGACCEEEACDCCDDEDGMASGAGGGAGAKVRPIAYIEVSPEGTHVQPIIDDQKVALGGILLGAWAIGWVGLVLKTLFTRRS